MAGPTLELTWPHKNEFLLVPKDDDGRPVWVPRDHPAANEVRLARFVSAVGETNPGDPHLDNTLFVGDSFDAMRVMCEVPEFAARYRGKVKLIYADPPFNTGQTFAHYDDWMEHATWLSFMRERLMLMKDLLSPDGSVWIHLDDAEVHRMRCVLDEVFGASNFVATVVWEKSYSPRNDSKTFSVAHDYILVYSRLNGWTSNRLARTEANDKNYKNPDNDPRGPWASDNYTTNKTKLERKNLWFPITRPADGAEIWPPENLTWRYSVERHEENERLGNVWWGKDGLNNSPRYKRRLEGLPELIPMTIWKHTVVGHNDEAKKEMKRLFPQLTPFSTPKPERLLERVIHIGTNPGDLVFDPFAGSGTTAAVAQKMGRRWATSELSGDTANDFVVPRLTKIVAGADPGGVTESTGWSGGGGFRTVLIEPSLYETGPDGLVFLREGVDAEDLSRAMCGQMRFTYMPDAVPFCGRRGRMLLAVVSGVIGVEEVDDLIAQLPDGTRLTLAAGALLQGTADHLTKCSRGSRALKIPRDVLTRTLRSATDQQSGETNG
jgi:adenine-specific DNA-methyltransferase